MFDTYIKHFYLLFLVIACIKTTEQNIAFKSVRKTSGSSAATKFGAKLDIFYSVKNMEFENYKNINNY